MRNIYFVFIMFVVISCSPLEITKKDYEVRLSPPLKEGQIIQLSSIVNERQKKTISMGEDIIENSNTAYNLDFEGIITIIQVYDIGTILKSQIAVQKCVQVYNDTEKSLIKGGTVIIALFKDDKKLFQIDGKPVSHEIHKALSKVLSSEEEGPTDDHVFGTNDRKKVGDSWPINKKLAIKYFKKKGFYIDEDDIEGVTKLKNIINIDHQKCIQINKILDIKNIKIKVDPELNIKKTAISAVFETLYPVESLKGPIEGKAKMSISSQIQVRKHDSLNEQEIIIEFTSERETTRKCNYMN